MKKIVILLSLGFFAVFVGLFFLVSRLLPGIIPVLDKPVAGETAGTSQDADRPGKEEGRQDTDNSAPADSAILESVAIDSPDLDDFLDNKFVLEGRAAGGWFKDGVLTINLLDANGKKIAASYAGGEGIWTKGSAVAFRAEFEYYPPPTEAGSLVFIDGPGGGRHYIPVKFRHTTAYAGEACAAAADCRLPGEYATRSNCPYRVECLHNKCTVVCPDF